MNALAFLLGSCALDLARSREPGATDDEPLGPIASTPETAAAWRRWSQAALIRSGSIPTTPSAVEPAPHGDHGIRGARGIRAEAAQGPGGNPA